MVPSWLSKPGWGQGICVPWKFPRGVWCLATSGNVCSSFRWGWQSLFIEPGPEPLATYFDYIIIYSYCSHFECCIFLPLLHRRKIRETERGVAGIKLSKNSSVEWLGVRALPCDVVGICVAHRMSGLCLVYSKHLINVSFIMKAYLWGEALTASSIYHLPILIIF